ncbi:riboflavin synthase [Myxococcota bacterium]|nr:riboflavin synthase [Myxococcota bacterium]MBU1429616.1 riboflavin synthase [Myxococcota bacterium]MBU1897422.1 riboflavin synthase [Myxococcota bacterium]
MFTGLIEAVGEVRRLTRRGVGAQIQLKAPAAMVAELTLGESVAVDGACLTVVEAGGEAFTVDASGETLRRTTLGGRRPGDPVHLERAMRLGDRFGGHIVAGHVDDTGQIERLTPVGEAVEIWITASETIERHLVNKGSIAVDGVSLTLNALAAGRFSVTLIPHTQRVIHLARKQPGARVNLETDIIGKYVERLLGRAGRPIDADLLSRAGFL